MKRLSQGQFALSIVILLPCLLLGGAASSAGDSTVQCSIPADFNLDRNTIPHLPESDTNKECQWDLFSWQTFAALNSPADPERRGVPRGTFSDSSSTTPLVWESFKEKAEVFNTNPSMDWNDQQPQVIHANVWDQHGGYCTETEEENKVNRTFYQSSKFHNTLDETVEVAGEALETRAELCRGNPPGCQAGTNPHGIAVGPRVWKVPTSQSNPTTDGARPVYYEVRVNYDFFNYVMKNHLYDDKRAFTNAILGKTRLPARYDAKYQKTSGVPNNNPGYKYAPYEPDECYAKGEELPCRIGSVHIKSAWIELTPEEIASVQANNGSSKYHITRAIYYKPAPAMPGAQGKVCKQSTLFALIGLHIIQRVHLPSGLQADSNPDAVALGGAFIFSTWEHQEITDGSATYKYVNYAVDQYGTTDTTPMTKEIYPALEDALTVRRLLLPPQPAKPADCDLSQPQTCAANAIAHQAIGDFSSYGTSRVWQNYKLVGTQFLPTCVVEKGVSPSAGECKKESNDLAQPYFLANLVIETNQGLQQFRGLPNQQPRIQPPQWASAPSGGNPMVFSQRTVPTAQSVGSFSRSVANMTIHGTAHNMGGCMGCHGVAQQNGYSFSFVLLDGTRGALADVESDPAQEVPPTNLTDSIAVGLQGCSGAQASLHDGFCHEGTVTSLEANASTPPEAVTGPESSDENHWRLLPFANDRPLQPRAPNFGGYYLLQYGEAAPERAILTVPQAGVPSAGCSSGSGGELTLHNGVVHSGSTGQAIRQLWKLIPYGGPSQFLLQLITAGGGPPLVLQAGGPGSKAYLCKIAGNPLTAGQVWRLHVPAPSLSGDQGFNRRASWSTRSTE